MDKRLDGEECGGEEFARGEHVGEIDGPIGDGLGCCACLDVEGCDDTERVGGAAESIVEFGIGCGGSVDCRTVSESRIETDNVVHCQTPCSGGEAVAAVGEVSANADAGTGPMRRGAFSVRV